MTITDKTATLAFAGVYDGPPERDIAMRVRQGALKTANKLVPAASSYNLATLLACRLTDGFKAASVSAGYARVGTVTGALTVVAGTPATGEISVAPNGDIVTLAADAITSLDVTWLPLPQRFAEFFNQTVSAHTFTFPTSFTEPNGDVVSLSPGVNMLFEVEANAGTSTGKKIVIAAGSAPAAGQCALNAAKTALVFAAADAVTRCRVKFGFGYATEDVVV